MNTARQLCVIMLGSMLIGCASTKTYTFNITVENKTDQPLMIFLTKSGPPVEPGWMSPENLVMLRQADDDSVSGAREVPSGKTLFTEKDVAGRFEPDTSAILRIYRGKFKSLSELLAVSSSSPDFLEITLPPGASLWTISNGPDGRMAQKGKWEKK